MDGRGADRNSARAHPSGSHRLALHHRRAQPLVCDPGTSMKLDGIHHITCITGDAARNVEYYTGTLGLRLVKKSVNQDDPTVYHLFYADEAGAPGPGITVFQYPGAAPRPGRLRRIPTRVCGGRAGEAPQ